MRLIRSVFLSQIFLIPWVHAQDAIAPPVTANQLIGVHFDDFSGGMNDTIPADSIPPNQSPYAQNVVIDDPVGSIKPRNGFAYCGTYPGGAAGRSLYEWKRADGSRRLIVAGNGSVYQTADCTAWTTIVTGLNANDRVYFESIRDKLWFTNRSSHVYSWDNSTAIPMDARALTPNPAPHRGNYIKFWKNRVWIARSEANPSGVAFSELNDSVGSDIDPSTHTAAFPAANMIYVNRDSGGPIYGIYVYSNRLYAFKEREIWNIDFIDEFNIQLVKTDSSVGTFYQSSIIEKEGFLYFVGPDGIYRFDGNRSIRISDNINGLFSSILQATGNLSQRVWTAATDFSAGTFSNTNEVSLVGSLSLSSTTYREEFQRSTLGAAWTAESGFSVNSSSRMGSTTGEAYATQTVSTGSFAFDLRVANSHANETKFKFISVGTSYDNDGGYSIQLINIGQSAHDTYLRRLPGPVTLAVKLSHVPTNGVTNINSYRVIRSTAGEFRVYEGDTLILGPVVDTTYSSSAYVVAEAGAGLSEYDNFFFYRYQDNGTWTSEIYNTVSVSSWSSFNAEHVLNQGSIGYEIRVGSNVGAVQAASFSAITPGSIINGLSNQTSAQVRVTITGSVVDKSLTPTTDQVSIAWYAAGSANNVVDASVWKNRIYVSVTTGTAANNNVVLASSRFNDMAWIPHTMQAAALALYNNNFYAAASTHTGVYRLDYGTNDNGSAFTWEWQTRDENFGYPYNTKSLWEMQVNFKHDSAPSVFLGWSRNGGVSFSTRSVDMSGSGVDSTRQFVNGGVSNKFRFRILEDNLDAVATIDRLSAYVRPSRFRE